MIYTLFPNDTTTYPYANANAKRFLSWITIVASVLHWSCIGSCIGIALIDASVLHRSCIGFASVLHRWLHRSCIGSCIGLASVVASVLHRSCIGLASVVASVLHRSCIGLASVVASVVASVARNKSVHSIALGNAHYDQINSCAKPN